MRGDGCRLLGDHTTQGDRKGRPYYTILALYERWGNEAVYSRGRACPYPAPILTHPISVDGRSTEGLLSILWEPVRSCTINDS